MRRLTAIALALLLAPPAFAQRGGGHIPDCNTLEGLKKARCERHTRMYDKCHEIKGEGHHECDRQFLVANPLDCTTLAGGDAEACSAERAAVQACKDETGTAFFRCARDKLRTDPRH